jgi:hypothetical protein
MTAGRIAEEEVSRMRRSAYRRAAAPSGRNRRLFAVGAVITALGAVVAFTTISNAAENDQPAGSGAGKVVNGQVILTDTCVDSKLAPHDGFQLGNRCVSTEFGEVGAAANNPSLLITDAPQRVAVNTPFTLKVSTRNLIRDRFLAAGKGGYYVESSVLQNGLVRGHFHTACRMLTTTNSAPAPEPVPAFFVATEDSKGGATPDEVSIQVPGLPTAGLAQCASWAGDGSHRIPMMERANQTPALDAVRITVGGRGNDTGGQTGDGNTGGQTGDGGNTGGQTGDGNTGGQNGGGNTGDGNGNAGGGNAGGGNNGATNTPTTAPTKTPPKGGSATTAPTTKDDFTPDPTTKPAVKPQNTTKPTVKPQNTTEATVKPQNTTKATTKATEESTGGDASTEENSGTDDTPTTEPTKKAAKPSKSSEAADITYSTDDGQFNSGNKAPVADQVAQVQASNGKKDTGALALTGSNTLVFAGGAVILVLAGLLLMVFTRRRRPGTAWE